MQIRSKVVRGKLRKVEPIINKIDPQQSEKLLKRLASLKNQLGLQFQTYSSPQYYWRHGQTPLGPVREFRLVRDGEMVAHQGFIPVALSHVGDILSGFQSSGTWVHPDFRGKGIGPALVHRASMELADEGHQFYYGFPNQTYHPVMRHSLQAVPICTALFLAKPASVGGLLQKKGVRFPSPLMKIVQESVRAVGNLPALGRKHPYDVRIESDFPEAIQQLLVANPPSERNYFVKNLPQLRWRYLYDRYTLFFCYDSQNTLLGYLVGRTHAKDGIDVAAVVDVHCDAHTADRKDIFGSLLAAFERHYRQSHLYAALALSHQWDCKTLTRWGYWKLPTRYFDRSFWFLFKPLRDHDFGPLDQGTWNITFYDSMDSF